MTFLDEIIARKIQEVQQAKLHAPLDKLMRSSESEPPVSSLKTALQNGPAPRIIAEIKRASPSRGAIKADLDAEATARSYISNGAAAISVLTDGQGFMGSLDDLRAARNVSETESKQGARTPILRKDFIVDPYQVWEARAAGADATLLIVAALGETKLKGMMNVFGQAGLEALIEVHNEDEMRVAINCGAEIIGINNRDLKTFEVDKNTALRLAKSVPKRSTLVVESGMKSPEDIKHYVTHGLRAFLIGESLVTAPDPGKRLLEFISIG